MLEQIIEESNVEPRNYQRRCVEQIDQQFNDIGVRSVLLESPTGSGKTCMALLEAKLQQMQHDIGIGWVAMRRNLLEQACRENIKLGVDVEDVEFISMFEKNPPTHDKKGRKIDLLIADEAQHDAANSMAAIHNALKPRWVLGMTATPFRTDRMKLCFDKVIKDIGIHQLIAKGYLSEYHLYTVPEYKPESVVNHYVRDKERWGKSVMFWHKTEDAVECTERLLATGVRAQLIHGSQPHSFREEQLERFEKGELDVLTNLFILTEGFDSPSLKTVFVRDSQRGPTIQMAGRVFRKYPGISYKNVVQSKFTHWPMIKTALPEESFTWLPEENEWRSYKLNPAIHKIAMQSTLMQARRDVVLPDLIKKHLDRRKSPGGWFNR